MFLHLLKNHSFVFQPLNQCFTPDRLINICLNCFKVLSFWETFRTFFTRAPKKKKGPSNHYGIFAKLPKAVKDILLFLLLFILTQARKYNTLHLQIQG